MTPMPPVMIDPVPLPADPGVSGGTSIYCVPNCYCQIYCMAPMPGSTGVPSGGMTPGGVGGTTSGTGGATSVYCPPCGTGGMTSVYCPPCGGATYCTPCNSVQVNPPVNSGSAPNQGQSNPGTIMPWACGPERWKALSAGKADVSAGWSGVCGGPVACPPYAKPVWISFTVHVIVQK